MSNLQAMFGRVADRVDAVNIGRAVGAVILFPFYVLGSVIGMAAAAVRWSAAAFLQGFDDQRRKAGVWEGVAVAAAAVTLVVLIWVV